jgi:hypothetical protein
VTSLVPPLVAKQVRERFIDPTAHVVSLEPTLEATTMFWLRLYESTVETLRKNNVQLDYVQLSGTEAAVPVTKESFIELRRHCGHRMSVRDYVKSKVNPEQETKK